METIRSFIAIQLDPALRENLSELQRRLRNADLQVKWVAPENIHLTMKFLGDVGTDKIEEIKTALRGAVGCCGPFTISVSGLGVFPDKRRPRIIWAGIREGKDELLRLAEMIGDACVRAGCQKDERGFVSHLTIARVKELHDPQAFFAKAQKFEDQEFGRMAVSKISLMKSTLTPKGPIYDIIHDVDLV